MPKSFCPEKTLGNLIGISLGAGWASNTRTTGPNGRVCQPTPDSYVCLDHIFSIAIDESMVHETLSFAYGVLCHVAYMKLQSPSPMAYFLYRPWGFLLSLDIRPRLNLCPPICPPYSTSYGLRCIPRFGLNIGYASAATYSWPIMPTRRYNQSASPS